MDTKKEFMLLFRYEPNMNYQPTEAELNTMHQEWGGYFGKLGGQGQMVSTHVLGFEGAQVSADKTVTEGFLVANNLMVSGNLIVSVNTMEEAIEIAKESPILNMGGSVEVRSIDPM
jgi:hypothetical protein